MGLVQIEERPRLLRIAKYCPHGGSLGAAYLVLLEEGISTTLNEVAVEAARGTLSEAPAIPREPRKERSGRQTLSVDLPRVVRDVAFAPTLSTRGHSGVAR